MHKASTTTVVYGSSLEQKGILYPVSSVVWTTRNNFNFSAGLENRLRHAPAGFTAITGIQPRTITRWEAHLKDLGGSCQQHHQMGSYQSPFRIPAACHTWHHLVTPRTSWKHLGPAGHTLDQMVTLSAFCRSHFKTDDILRDKRTMNKQASGYRGGYFLS